MTISRFVALITPLLAAAAGYISVQVAQLPGAPVLDPGQLTVVFVTGAASATAAAVKWLHGRSQHELQTHFEGEYTVQTREVEQSSPSQPDGGEDRDEVAEARTLLGLVGVDAELARLRAAVGAHDERLDHIEFPRGAGTAGHHPV